MFFRLIYLFIVLTIFNVLIWGSEHQFSISSSRLTEFSSSHWKHPGANSALDINQIKIDVFQWRAAADSKDAI